MTTFTHTTGFTYKFEDGTEVWSREEMSPAELIVHKKMADEMAANYVEVDEEDYEPYYTLGEPRLRDCF